MTKTDAQLTLAGLTAVSAHRFKRCPWQFHPKGCCCTDGPTGVRHFNEADTFEQNRSEARETIFEEAVGEAKLEPLDSEMGAVRAVIRRVAS